MPGGYVLDENRVRLGSGRDLFESAKAALQKFEMMQLGWFEPAVIPVVVEPGCLAPTLARVGGLWFVNVCRIVYVVDESDEQATRYGFGQGTLHEHAERGEERFLIERRHDDDSVWYDIRAFSRPAWWAAKLGYPFVRRLQKCFARDSLRVMQRLGG